jgi:hypothetical protein
MGMLYFGYPVERDRNGMIYLRNRCKNNNRPDGLFPGGVCLLAEREREFVTRETPWGLAFVSFSVAWLWRRPKSTSGSGMCQSIGLIFLDLEWEIAVFAQLKAVFGPEKSVLISVGRVLFRTAMRAPGPGRTGACGGAGSSRARNRTR